MTPDLDISDNIILLVQYYTGSVGRFRTQCFWCGTILLHIVCIFIPSKKYEYRIRIHKASFVAILAALHVVYYSSSIPVLYRSYYLRYRMNISTKARGLPSASVRSRLSPPPPDCSLTSFNNLWSTPMLPSFSRKSMLQKAYPTQQSIIL